MKAIRKSDGKVIEVKPYCPPQEDYDNYKYYPFEDYYITSDNEVLSNYDLDFGLEEAEEVTIDGWVARDEDGKAYLHSIRPERGFDDDRNVGIWGNCVGHQMIALKRIFPSLTWKSEPLEVTITIKPKKKR